MPIWERSGLQRRSDLGGKIAVLLLDTLAELEAGVAHEPDWGAGLLGCRPHHLADPALAVDYVDLLEQDGLLIELAQLALDDFVDDRVGLADLARPVAQNLALPLERRPIN